MAKFGRPDMQHSCNDPGWADDSTAIAHSRDGGQLPAGFPKAKRLYVAVGDHLPRLRDWFGAFYHKPEMADQAAVWGSPQRIANEIARFRDAGVNNLLLHPVFEEESQMDRLCEQVLSRLNE